MRNYRLNDNDRAEVFAFLTEAGEQLSLSDRRKAARTLRELADGLEQGHAGTSVMAVAAIVATDFTVRELLEFDLPASSFPLPC